MLIDDLQFDEGTSIRLACLDSADITSDSAFYSIKLPLKTLDRSTRINPDIVATLVASLRTKVVELEAQWRDLSVSNGARVSNAISEQKIVVSSSSEIQRSANDVAASMQRLRVDFSERIHSLVELDVAYTRLVDARALFDRILHILLDIQHIYVSMKNEEWYHAAKAYCSACCAHRDFLQRGDLVSLFWHKSEQRTEDNATNNISRSLLHDELNLIPKFLLASLDGIEHQLTQKVSSMLTDWFSSSNALSEQIGRSAMSICALESTSKLIELEQKEKSFHGMIQHEGSIDAVTTSLGNKLICVIQQRREFRKVVERQLDFVSSSLQNILKAASIEGAFMDSSKVLEQYIEAREGQLGSFLVPPNKVKQQGKYFHQLLGFFLIEIDVYMNIPWLGTKQYLQTIWEGTSSAMMAEIGSMLDEASSPQGMVDLKTSALHLCLALERYNMNIINTKPIRDVCITRLDRFLNLLHEPTMVSLEAAESDLELLTASVRACLHNITKYLEGLVPNNSLQYFALAEADKMFSKLMLPVLLMIADEESCDNGVPEKLLAFIETVAFMQELLIYNVEQNLDSVHGKENSLDLLLYDAILKLSSILGKKIVAEAMESLLAKNLQIYESSSELISSWSESVIDQFEFYRQEFDEFGFGEQLGTKISVLLADNIVLELCLHFDRYAGSISKRGAEAFARDLDALRKTFTSLGPGTENKVLLDMLTISNAISNGNLDTMQTIANSRMDKHLERFFTTVLEHYTKFSKNSSHRLDKAAMKKLADSVKGCIPE